MLPVSIKQAYSSVPAGIKVFAKKALTLLSAWLVLYYLIMQPLRVPDKWLTSLTASITVKTLNALYKPGFKIETGEQVTESYHYIGDQILYRSKPALLIADACNAVDVFVLYISFFICLPTSKRRAILFAVVGIAGIFILNIFRCFGLTWLALNKQAGWILRIIIYLL